MRRAGPERGWEDAYPVQLQVGGITRLQLQAPPGSPTVPGDWVDVVDPQPVTSDPVEDFSSSKYVAFDNDEQDPDEWVAANPDDHYNDDYYAAAWMSAYTQNGVPSTYYEIGLTTFTTSVLGGATFEPPAPGLLGPEIEFAEGGQPALQVRGEFYLGVLEPTDPVADELSGAILTFARVPSAFVENNGNYGNLQYSFAQYPTLETLESWPVVLQLTLPDVDDPTLEWDEGTNGFLAYVPVDETISIDPAWLDNGHVHFAYWFTRADGTRLLESTYSQQYSSSLAVNWSSAQPGAGPIGFPLYSVAPGPVLGYFGSQQEQTGYWAKDATDEVWLEAKGSIPGYRWGYQTYSQYPIVSENRGHTRRWRFAQIADEHFGLLIAVNFWDQLVVVTPTKVIYFTGTSPVVETVLATHTTPFLAGEEVEMVVASGPTPTISVRRNDVEVSSFVLPSGVSMQFPGPFAREANSGNRISGGAVVTEPTDVGYTECYFEFDDTFTTGGVFTAPPPSRYRWLSAVGYPVASVESFRDDYASYVRERAVMWIKLELPPGVDCALVWIAPVNPTAFTNPDTLPSDYGYLQTFRMDYAIQRHDGEVIIDESINFARNAEQGVLFRFFNEAESVLDFAEDEQGYTAYADGLLSLSTDLPGYLFIDFGPIDSPNRVFWSESWNDLQFVCIPQPQQERPKVWQWQPGDNRRGLQGIGYAHDATELTTTISQQVEGTALLVQCADESYGYLTRDTIFGYTEELGLFHYGHVQQYGAQQDQFDAGQIYTYGDVRAADSVGRHFHALEHGSVHTAQAPAPVQYLGRGEWYGGVVFDIGSSFHFAHYAGFLGYVNSSQMRWASDAQGAYLAVAHANGRINLLGLIENYHWMNKRHHIRCRFTFAVPSANAGVYVRGTQDAWRRIAVSGSQLLRQYQGGEQVLGSWPLVAADQVIELLALEDDIWVYVDGVEVAHAVSDQGDVLVSDSYNAQDGSPLSIDGQAYGSWARGVDGARLRPPLWWSVKADPEEALDLVGPREQGAPVLVRPQASALSAYLGRLVDGEVPWPLGATQDIDVDPLLRVPQTTVRTLAASPLYPNSVFVQAQRSEIGPADEMRLFELHADTGEVIREMAPFGQFRTHTNFTAWYVPRLVTASASGRYLTGIVPGNAGVAVPPTEQVYDLITEQVVSVQSTPSNNNDPQYLGDLADGRRVYVGRNNYVRIADSETGTLLAVNLQAYSGKGYNGALIGFDGRYVWGHRLNYHVDYRTYRLTPEDVAGTDLVAGTVVNTDRGLAQFFAEVFRYDLEAVTDWPSVLVDVYYEMRLQGTEELLYTYDSGRETPEINHRPDLLIAHATGPMFAGGGQWILETESFAVFSYLFRADYRNPYTKETTYTLYAGSGGYGIGVFTHQSSFQDWDDRDEGASIYTTPATSVAPIEYVANLDYPRNEFRDGAPGAVAPYPDGFGGYYYRQRSDGYGYYFANAAYRAVFQPGGGPGYSPPLRFGAAFGPQADQDHARIGFGATGHRVIR